jgi:hypothetical protein
MKRIALTVASMAAAFAALRQWRARRADAELWEEATAPRDLR